MSNFSNVIDKFVNPILEADHFPIDAVENLHLARNAANKDPEGSGLSKT